MGWVQAPRARTTAAAAAVAAASAAAAAVVGPTAAAAVAVAATVGHCALALPILTIFRERCAECGLQQAPVPCLGCLALASPWIYMAAGLDAVLHGRRRRVWWRGLWRRRKLRCASAAALCSRLTLLEGCTPCFAARLSTLSSKSCGACTLWLEQFEPRCAGRWQVSRAERTESGRAASKRKGTRQGLTCVF